MILLLAWTLGNYALWLHTHYMMTLRKKLYEEISGEHRAILELAAAMQRELDVEHIDPLVLREKQLKERINIEILGGRISYVHLMSILGQNPSSTACGKPSDNGSKRRNGGFLRR